ncbi:MAG: hypothetical protein F6J97_25335, partial [Leptolyngbya sp. SIO4C1]|nr:hypothetical protein [Leptolyngbya sp. SIO4C1]
KSIKFSDIKLANLSKPELPIRTGDSLLVKFDYSKKKEVTSPAFVIFLRDMFGQEILRLSTMPISGYSISSLFEKGAVELEINNIPLVAGQYSIDIGFARERTEWLAKLEGVIDFDICPQDIYNSGLLMDRSRGLIVVNHRWKHRSIDEEDKQLR